MKKTWEFGPLLVTVEVITKLEEVGCFPKGKGTPPRGETVLKA